MEALGDGIVFDFIILQSSHRWFYLFLFELTFDVIFESSSYLWTEGFLKLEEGDIWLHICLLLVAFFWNIYVWIERNTVKVSLLDQLLGCQLGICSNYYFIVYVLFIRLCFFEFCCKEKELTISVHAGYNIPDLVQRRPLFGWKFKFG